jgi:hypothetical protein
MTRALYAALLRLHPPGFRRQFATEMLWIFDEARVSEGAVLLLLDGAVSLLRQWLLRSGLWMLAAALLGAMLQVVPALSWGPHRHSAPIPRTGVPVQMGEFVAITLGTIVFVVSMVVASVFWSAKVSRLKTLAARRRAS